MRRFLVALSIVCGLLFAALKGGMVPEKALYGPNAPLMLRAIAAISVEATKKIARIGS